MGRSWVGHPVEDACPCHKAACGLVDEAAAECDQHWFSPFARTMRQIHMSERCPALERDTP